MLIRWPAPKSWCAKSPPFARKSTPPVTACLKRRADAHPQLPAADEAESFGSISSAGDPPIDASGWIIPESAMDLDLVVGGLMLRLETQALPVE